MRARHAIGRSKALAGVLCKAPSAPSTPQFSVQEFPAVECNADERCSASAAPRRYDEPASYGRPMILDEIQSCCSGFVVDADGVGLEPSAETLEPSYALSTHDLAVSLARGVFHSCCPHVQPVEAGRPMRRLSPAPAINFASRLTLIRIEASEEAAGSCAATQIILPRTRHGRARQSIAAAFLTTAHIEGNSATGRNSDVTRRPNEYAGRFSGRRPAADEASRKRMIDRVRFLARLLWPARPASTARRR